jgi:hypothetical protein
MRRRFLSRWGRCGRPTSPRRPSPRSIGLRLSTLGEELVELFYESHFGFVEEVSVASMVAPISESPTRSLITSRSSIKTVVQRATPRTKDGDGDCEVPKHGNRPLRRICWVGESCPLVSAHNARKNTIAAVRCRVSAGQARVTSDAPAKKCFRWSSPVFGVFGTTDARTGESNPSRGPLKACPDLGK